VSDHITSKRGQTSWLFASSKAQIHARGHDDNRESSWRIAEEYEEDQGKHDSESAASSKLNVCHQLDRRQDEVNLLI
jgi:hypothetical protein